jgi:hypothetical protein
MTAKDNEQVPCDPAEYEAEHNKLCHLWRETGHLSILPRSVRSALDEVPEPAVRNAYGLLAGLEEDPFQNAEPMANLFLS